MPLPLVKERKQRNKGFIGNVYLGIFTLYLMAVKHTAIQIRDAPELLLKLPVVGRFVQSIRKEAGQKTTIEGGKETVFATLLATPVQLIAQIVHIAVQKTFLLNKITEHQAVKHHRGIPLLVSVVLFGQFVIYAPNEFCKCLMFLAEACIKVLGNFFGIDRESTVDSRLHIDNSCPLSRVKLQILHLREKEVCLFG